MLRSDILTAAAALGAFAVTFGVGFIVGYGFKYLKIMLLALQSDIEDHKAEHVEEERPESAIVDSSPQHLRAKAEERIQRGEDPIDDNESQIINTKTPQQIADEAAINREEKLDKWMPGVRGGKS